MSQNVDKSLKRTDCISSQTLTKINVNEMLASKKYVLRT